jgi:hypothetical protein
VVGNHAGAGSEGRRHCDNEKTVGCVLRDRPRLAAPASRHRHNSPLRDFYQLWSREHGEFAYEYGYNQVFVEDACAGNSSELHKMAMDSIFKRIGRVRTTEDVLWALRS